ncbi:hypothetical protein JXB31_02820 [Candidatus Woesearchaeota archaeon]|nr:hypothetical protein [Candidatus Woesearchaeota archaeon]
MMYLILSLPFLSSAALASISSANVYGKHGIDGCINSIDDFLHAEVVVDGLTSADLVRIDYLTDSSFDSCVFDETTARSSCTYTTSRTDRSAGEYDYTIRQYDADMLILGMHTGKVYVDGLAPVIGSVDVSLSGRNITISYFAEDKACDSCLGICSGLSSINLYLDGGLIESLPINSSACTKTGIFRRTVSEFGLPDGAVELCFSAVDNMNHSSAMTCVTETIDTTRPVFDEGSFSIKDKLGNDVNYISQTQRDAIISVNITDLDLDIGSVHANLSALNDVLGSQYVNLLAECVKTDEALYSCYWRDIKIRGDPGEKRLFLSLSDTSGNSAEHTFAVTFSQDINSPVINRIYNNPAITYNDTALFLRNGLNKVKLELANDGSGYNDRQVFIDFSTAAAPPGSKQAGECLLADNVWTCSFDVNSNGQSGERTRISVLELSRDDAGNFLNRAYNTMAVIDSVAPEVEEISMENICPYSGQDMVIEVIVEDNSPVSLMTTPSKITETGKTYVALCDQLSTTEQICTLKIDDLVSSHTTETLELNITDAALNTHIGQYQVEVCEAADGSPSGLISAIGLPLNKVDLRALSFMDIPVFAQININTGIDVQVIDMMIDCGQDFVDEHIYDKTSMSPILSMKAKSSSNATKENKRISAECDLALIVKSGNNVYTEPEHEQLIINGWDTFSNPLGTIDETMEQKLESIDQQIKDTEDEIKEWESWNKWLSILCSIAEMLAMLDVVMGVVKGVAYLIANTLCSNHLTVVAGAKLWGLVCKYTSMYDKFINKFIWTPGVALSWSVIPKWMCMVYSCKLCTMDDGKVLADMTGIDGGIFKIALTGFTMWAGGFGVLTSIGLGASAVSAGAGWMSEENDPNSLSYMIGGFTLDPYKSIHAASSCLCIPGIIYNLKKEKQIRCMYKTCIQKNAMLGLPLETCDQSYAFRECLYVDGAQWKLMGSSGIGFIQTLVSFMFRNIGILIAGTIWQLECGSGLFPDSVASFSTGLSEESGCVGCPVGNPAAWSNLLCHLSGSALMLSEIGEFNIVPDFDKYSGTLEGETVCGEGSS